MTNLFHRLKEHNRLSILFIFSLTTILCVTLVALRVQYTTRITFVFLVWNIFLALIPYIISTLLVLYHHRLGTFSFLLLHCCYRALEFTWGVTCVGTAGTLYLLLHHCYVTLYNVYCIPSSTRTRTALRLSSRPSWCWATCYWFNLHRCMHGNLRRIRTIN
jgi:hypothetical protein